MIELSGRTTKRDMNHWLSAPFDEAENWSWRFDFGSDALGTNWQTHIPVTGLLLAAISAGKVEAEIAYHPPVLAGGFNLHLRRINGDVISEDFDNLSITRKQAYRMWESKR